MSRTNQIIKIDLHIHSAASKYKESPGIVDNSTKENLPTLLSKLNEHEVSLFSITDHNRFDSNLYKEIFRILSDKNNPYTNVKTVLAGIEFDVILDEVMDKCHIIAIFDTKNDVKNFDRIENALEPFLIYDIGGAYQKNKFEEVLKSIGLDVILIASQTKDINNRDGKHNAISDSVKDVNEIIKVGYISALEYQKPKVEGILISNLKEKAPRFPLISGSDCHDWRHYPHHDEKNHNREFIHTEIRMLPTFKGLLMAITSPETRFNSQENVNNNYIESIDIGDNKILLAKGINTIIGENGSGKTTLLHALNSNMKKEKHVKELLKENKISSMSQTSSNKIKQITQGEIVKKYNEGTLFSLESTDLFEKIDDSAFYAEYTNYANALFTSIDYSIKKRETIEGLKKHEIEFVEIDSSSNYFIDVSYESSFGERTNEYSKTIKELRDTISKIELLLKDSNLVDYKEKIQTSIKELEAVYYEINKKYEAKQNEIVLKNIVIGSIVDYSNKVKLNSTKNDNKKKTIRIKRQTFIDQVYNAAKVSIEKDSWPTAPRIIQGASTSHKKGFNFNRESEYNNASKLELFYSKMFINKYSDIEKLKKIKTTEDLKNSITGCTNPIDINRIWKENLNKFFDEATRKKEYITENNTRIGNTLGELSLSYYKFTTNNREDWDILIIDQPEDNISNNNISKKLVTYLNSIRYEKQIIFATHNPLLVVNLDADNIIYLEKDGRKIKATSGCIEYEDDFVNILEIIATNMDGGKEAIEKRLRIYG